MSGILYGIGVGPGDPELLTLKAVKIMKACDVLLLPSAPKEECYAYKIVYEAVPEIREKEIVCKPFPMIKDPDKLAAAHDKIYGEIETYLDNGEKVAFLTIGDPSVYSTYSYIHARALRRGKDAIIVSGVPSFCAVAARLGIPLGDNRNEIHVIPGSYAVEETMSLKGTRVYMKSGKKLEELRQKLRAENASGELDVYAVSNCGMPDEKVTEGLENLDIQSGYLTIVIVKEHME